VSLCDAADAALISSAELTMRLEKPPSLLVGSQPFDRAKRHCAKCEWTGPGAAACVSAIELRVFLSDKEEKLRRTPARLLDSTAAWATSEAKKAKKKRHLSDVDLRDMNFNVSIGELFASTRKTCTYSARYDCESHRSRG
jgi:hypothetical protein